MFTMFFLFVVGCGTTSTLIAFMKAGVGTFSLSTTNAILARLISLTRVSLHVWKFVEGG
jgi:hypothetical protein